MNLSQTIRQIETCKTITRIINIVGTAWRDGSPAPRRRANELLSTLPPYYDDADGYAVLYRGMSREEARLILSGEYDAIGFYYTPLASKAAFYAGRRGLVLKCVAPRATIKYALDDLDEVWISPAEALPNAGIGFYRVLFGRVLIPCRPRRNQ